VLFVSGRGKSAARAEIEALAEAGNVVLALDARGLGETRIATQGASDWSRILGDYDSAMTALLTGSSLVGMRALDIVRGLDLLAARPDVDAARISAVGNEQAAVPLLHAAVLDPRIGKVVLDGMLVSYMRMVEQRVHRGMFEQVVRGVLQSYDLPDLAAALGPRPVLIADAVNPMGHPLPLAEARKEFGRAPNTQWVRRGPADAPGAAYRDFISR
jgi:cephalosporin-C deacetylase-like acetyl esterase